MELEKLPKELRRLVENYNSQWGSSVRLWKKPTANADDIERSDYWAEEAAKTEKDIVAYCEKHSIDLKKVKNLMGSDK